MQSLYHHAPWRDLGQFFFELSLSQVLNGMSLWWSSESPIDRTRALFGPNKWQSVNNGSLIIVNTFGSIQRVGFHCLLISQILHTQCWLLWLIACSLQRIFVLVARWHNNKVHVYWLIQNQFSNPTYVFFHDINANCKPTHYFAWRLTIGINCHNFIYFYYIDEFRARVQVDQIILRKQLTETVNYLLTGCFTRRFLYSKLPCREELWASYARTLNVLLLWLVILSANN